MAFPRGLVSDNRGTWKNEVLRDGMIGGPLNNGPMRAAEQVDCCVTFQRCEDRNCID